MDGEPAAVNIGCPAVSSPGLGSLWTSMLSPLADVLGGMDGVFQLVADAFVNDNKGLKYADLKKNGFVVLKATKVRSRKSLNEFNKISSENVHNLCHRLQRNITLPTTFSSNLKPY